MTARNVDEIFNVQALEPRNLHPSARRLRARKFKNRLLGRQDKGKERVPPDPEGVRSDFAALDEAAARSEYPPLVIHRNLWGDPLYTDPELDYKDSPPPPPSSPASSSTSSDPAIVV
ncbi:uncharacterized protein GIQ15_05043 [Arthroderma uncinatum]|uniref:uncharacterized protein n=1 Tax=Arthroderma uncinatum TaxID=74035 RepID=UPI00144A858E|nr:uncharacterized protein GIQ15_05043 [Arthroderma uncinatum]KAF3482284.1 hypothetical protein GIQ15_05043 [Arthroderma uncinatum]